MIDAYHIGITLKINDLVGLELIKLAQKFEELDMLALNLGRRIKSIGTEVLGIKALTLETGLFDRQLGKTNAQAILLEKNVRALNAIKFTAPSIQNFSHAGGRAQSPTFISPPIAVIVSGPAPINPPKAHAHGGGAGGRNGGHGGGIHGGNLHAGSGGMGISNLGLGLPPSVGVPLIVGAAGIYTAHTLYEAAKDYEMAFNRFKSLNLGDAVNADAEAFTRSTKQFGVTMTERMTILRDMHEVMGSYSEAKAVTPLFARMMAANSGVFGEEGNKFTSKTFQALGKVIEMRGGTNSEKEMFKQADFAQKTLTGSAGLVTPEDLLAFMKTGGVATRLLSNKAFYEESAPLIQEMSGTRYGTALMSAHQNLAMGRGSLKSLKEAARLGIIDPKMIEYTTTGTIKQVLPGALVDSDLYNTSKYQWLMKDLIPAIRSKGLRGKDGMVTGANITDDQIVNELNTIFSQRTAGNAFAQMFLQRFKIDKNVAVTEGAMGIAQLEALNKNSPVGTEKEFVAAWTDFKAEFGKSVLPAVTSMLKTGAEMLRYLGSPSISGINSKTVGVEGSLVPKGLKPINLGLTDLYDHWKTENNTPIMIEWRAKLKAQAVADYKKSEGVADNLYGPQRFFNPVASGSGSPVVVHTSVALDGRTIATAVNKVNASAISAPQASIGRMDFNRMAPSPGMNIR